MNILRMVLIQCLSLFFVEIIAISDVKRFTVHEEQLFELLNGYIRSRQEEINELKRMAENFWREIISKSDAPQSTSNPVIAFRETWRLVKDWKTARYLITGSGAKNEFRRKWRDIEKIKGFPTVDDLSEASAHLVTNVDEGSNASEQKIGAAFTSKLTASECYELGQFLYTQLEFKLSTQWLSAALTRYDTNDEWLPIDKTYLQKTLKWKIYNYLPLSIFFEGKREESLNLIKEILNEFNRQEEVMNIQELIEKTDPTYDNSEAYLGTAFLQERYETLCKTGLPKHSSNLSKLKCRYVSTSPFTRLARIREEEYLLNPRILVFRNVIHDSEIERIKQEVFPYLKRGLVASKTGHGTTSSLRIAKQQLLTESEDLVRKIKRRVEDISWMSTETAEPAIAVNYGLGGHYNWHYDHDHTDDGSQMLPEWEGNRIATLLFFLSDVEKGGETVFPHLNLTVRPEKGSVLMWRNLLYNGDGDKRSLHAACPVFHGSKWVIAYLLHTGGNEFRQPCKRNRFE